MNRKPDNNSRDDTLLEFPCSFPIKVMGRSADDLQTIVEEIVVRHVESDQLLELRQTHSRAGNYVSVTVTVLAQTKSQLDAIYYDLTRHDLVIMAL